MSRIRVLVVDDSVVVRRLVSDALSRDPRVVVVGTAANGRIALAKVEQLSPDLVTMDVEMPEMNGIEAVRALRAAGHRMPIVMCSTLTARGAAATLDALVAGASDYVQKPSRTRSLRDSLDQVGGELLPKIHALVTRPGAWVEPVAHPDGAAPGRRARVGGTPSTVQAGAVHPHAAVERPHQAAPQTTVPRRPLTGLGHRPRAVVVGSSTGGPEALATVLGALPALPVPVLLAQHMPPVFTTQLASRLDRVGRATVVEAEDGMELRPGSVYVAPGDRHLVLADVDGVLRARLTDGPPVNFCRPSVDELFRSAVRALGGDLLAVVLTGMGSDGRAGCEDVVDAGGTVLVQDEASSVVWGMPGAVATAGLAHRVLPLGAVAAAMESVVRHGPADGVLDALDGVAVNGGHR